MNKINQLLKTVDSLKKGHYECDDCWYSCPKSGNCADDTLDDDECNCGVDRENARLDAIKSMIITLAE